MYKTWFMGTLDSVTCTSAIFAWWKVRGSKFAQPPDGGVFGSGVLRRAWYVTRTACPTRILTRTAQAVSERARQSTSQRRRRRASRGARSRSRTRLRLYRKIQYILPILRGGISHQYIFQYLESQDPIHTNLSADAGQAPLRASKNWRFPTRKSPNP